MPLLAGLLTTLFSAVVAWFAQYVTRKVAFGLASVAVMSALTLSLFVLMRGSLAAINGFSSSAPTMFVQMMALAVPPAASFCMSTYMTVWTACTVYTWQKDLIHLFAQS